MTGEWRWLVLDHSYGIWVIYGTKHSRCMVCDDRIFKYCIARDSIARETVSTKSFYHSLYPHVHYGYIKQCFTTSRTTAYISTFQ